MRVLRFGLGWRVRRVMASALAALLVFFLAALTTSATSLASEESAHAVAWGSGIEGELGNGTFNGESEENPLNYHPLAVAICEVGSPGSPCPSGPFLSAIAGISGGGQFALGLLDSGAAISWGGGSEGELGTGGEAAEKTPQFIPGLGSAVVSVSAGKSHSLALLRNGTVKSWGDNVGGDLGQGTCCAKNATPGLVSGLSGAVAVSAGADHSLALLSNGTVKAWGTNNHGQLGNGSTENSDVPVTVSGLSEVIAISAGGCCEGGDSLALLSNGTVRAWGQNDFGQLGNGSTTDSDVPVTVSGLSGVSAIASSSYDGYALLSTGAVKAWGLNRNGQLGDGSNTGGECVIHEEPENSKYSCSTTPVSVSGISSAVGIASSGGFALALLSNRTVVAWGNNNPGDLGDGTDTGPEHCIYEPKKELKLNEACSTSPVQVTGVRGARAIAAGGGTGYAYGSGAVSTPSPEERRALENAAERKQLRACAGEPVDCATGNEVLSETDLGIGGRGVGLNVVRTYNAQGAVSAATPEPFGRGWTSTFTDHLLLNSEQGTITVVQANGSTVVFKGTPGTVGTYTAPAWAQATLSLNSEHTYVYTLPSQEVFKFNEEGRLLSEADRDGNTTTLAYDASKQLETVTDPAGRKLTFAYNGEGFVESIKDPMGHTVKYAYEGGNLASVTEPGEASARWQFKYDTSHRVTTITDGRGGTTTNEYDSSNRVTSQKDPAGRELGFKYGFYETIITNKATGSLTREFFTEGGEPESITRGWGTSSATTEAFIYNEAGDLISATDGNGHTTRYTYNAANDRTSMVDPDGNETKWSYDSTHDVTATTTPKGETTTIKREEHGNPEVIERPAPAGKTQLTKYKFGSSGLLESVTDPLERTTKYEYDSQGDRNAEIDPEGDKRTWKYNEDSQETSSVSPRGNVEGGEPAKFTTSIERDAQGRTLKVTDPLGHTTKYVYDGNSNLETQTDANSHTTTYTYDADNERTKVKEPNGTVTETGYDGAGQITSQTDGNKHETKYARNILEQVTEAEDALKHKTTKEYDAAGNLTKLTDPAKRTTTYKYDPANRLTEVTYSSGKPATITYEYDKDGDRTKMIDGTGTTKYTYDQLDRLTESEDGHKDIAKYEYDLANQQTKITYPNTKSVTRAYDKAGQLEKVTDWEGHATSFKYDPDSDLTATVFPSNEDKYTFNEADQLTETAMKKGTETLASLVYTRDNDGQVKEVTSKGLPGEEKPAYEYDSNNRLTKGAGVAYEYDAADNPTKTGSSTNTFNAGDELEKGTGVTFSYDELGERTKRSPTSGGATTYGYDQAGNPLSIERPKEGKKAELKDTYTYDGNGLRASQTISGTQTFFTWDATEGLPVILNDGTNSYVYGPGGLPVEQVNGSTFLYLHHDQQGSTRLLTSSTGAKEASFTYDAYGNTTGTTGTAKTPLGYDAQYTSSDTGLIYLRARTYDPATAQFLSVDPIGAITREPYTYAGDNPTRHGDRTGLGSGFEAELPEGVPCIPPFCVPPSVHEGFENAFEGVEHGAETVWNEINENEGPNDEGAEALKERQAKEAACPPPDGNQLRREGEDILGRGHNPAKRQPWNEWWKQLSREAKKAYDRANGPRPRKGT